MERVPPFRKLTANGCKQQVARARNCTQTIEEVLEMEAALLTEYPLEKFIKDAADVGCECRIAENGLIDSSLCRKEHPLYPVPFLSRWCDQTTCRLKGAGHLSLWSGWARPSVMSLIGRHPTAAQINHLQDRTDKAVSHANFKFNFIPRHDPDLNAIVFDINTTPVNGIRARAWLRSTTPTVRVGQHTLHAETSS